MSVEIDRMEDGTGFEIVDDFVVDGNGGLRYGALHTSAVCCKPRRLTLVTDRSTSYV
jgi:hypothetical protein